MPAFTSAGRPRGWGPRGLSPGPGTMGSRGPIWARRFGRAVPGGGGLRACESQACCPPPQEGLVAGSPSAVPRAPSGAPSPALRGRWLLSGLPAEGTALTLIPARAGLRGPKPPRTPRVGDGGHWGGAGSSQPPGQRPCLQRRGKVRVHLVTERIGFNWVCEGWQEAGDGQEAAGLLGCQEVSGLPIKSCPGAALPPPLTVGQRASRRPAVLSPGLSTARPLQLCQSRCRWRPLAPGPLWPRSSPPGVLPSGPVPTAHSRWLYSLQSLPSAAGHMGPERRAGVPSTHGGALSSPAPSSWPQLLALSPSLSPVGQSEVGDPQ